MWVCGVVSEVVSVMVCEVGGGWEGGGGAVGVKKRPPRGAHGVGWAGERAA